MTSVGLLLVHRVLWVTLENCCCRAITVHRVLVSMGYIRKLLLPPNHSA